MAGLRLRTSLMSHFGAISDCFSPDLNEAPSFGSVITVRFAYVNVVNLSIIN
jgi:hypothetical protein